MPGDNKKDEQPKTPPGGYQRTTPYGSQPPSDAATDLDITEPSLRPLRQRYDLLGEVGRGGMGIVYRARDRETGDTVALKVLKPEIAARPELIERFKAELLLARKITHKNVCRTYELLRFGSTVAIAMEYVEGESLRAVLERFGGVPLRRGLEWAGQVCSGLAEAHAQGVVHRDLKPENIVIDRKAQAKVMDFGIARSLESDATKTGTLIGTPAYMSPEQAEGKPPDARSDIYSLGLILYEMFTGRRAFLADTPVALALKQIQEAPPPPREVEPHLPAFLDRAIQRCLEKNPKKRFHSVADLETALRGEAEPKLVVAVEEPAEVPVPLHLARWQRTDWILFLLGSASILVFFLVFPWFHPAKASQMEIHRQEAEKQAEQAFKALGWDDPVPEGELSMWGSRYWGSPGRLKLHDTLQILLHEASGVPWVGYKWLKGAAPTQGSPKLYLYWAVGGNGKVLRVGRFDVRSRPTVQRNPADQAVAAEAVKKVLGVDVSQMEPMPEKNYYEHYYGWKLPVGGQAQEFVGAVVQSGRVEWVSRGFDLGTLEGFSLRDFWGDFEDPRDFRYLWLFPFTLHPRAVTYLLVLFPLLLFLFFKRGLSRRWFFRPGLFLAGLLSLGIVVGRWDSLRLRVGKIEIIERLASPEQILGFSLYFALIAALLLAVTLYAALSTLRYYLLRTLPAPLASVQEFLTSPLRSRPGALSILRGTWLGLALVAAYGTAVWGASYSLTAFPYLDAVTSFAVPENTLPWMSYFDPILAGVYTACFWIAFPLAVARRVTKRFLVLLSVPLVVWTAAAFSLPGAIVRPAAPFYVCIGLQALFFAWVFLQFDLLTTSAAAFTAETLLVSYPLFVIFEKIEPIRYGVGLLPWLVLVLFAGLVFVSPQLLGAYRRVAAIFE